MAQKPKGPAQQDSYKGANDGVKIVLVDKDGKKTIVKR